jgi:hypothetical protein
MDAATSITPRAPTPTDTPVRDLRPRALAAPTNEALMRVVEVKVAARRLTEDQALEDAREAVAARDQMWDGREKLRKAQQIVR